MPAALPRYQLGGAMFIPPDLIDAGSIIETDMPPAEHFKPLNAAARKAMEDWYEEGVPYMKYDENGVGTEQVAYPHRKYRLGDPKKAAQYKTKVLRRAKEQPVDPEMSTGFAFLKPAQEQKLPPPLLAEDEDLSTFDQDEDESEAPAAKVLQPGPRPTTAIRT